jgi:hypothetical protein
VDALCFSKALRDERVNRSIVMRAHAPRHRAEDLRALVAAGAWAGERDGWGRTALHLAAESERVEIGLAPHRRFRNGDT